MRESTERALADAAEYGSQSMPYVVEKEAGMSEEEHLASRTEHACDEMSESLHRITRGTFEVKTKLASGKALYALDNLVSVVDACRTIIGLCESLNRDIRNEINLEGGPLLPSEDTQKSEPANAPFALWRPAYVTEYTMGIGSDTHDDRLLISKQDALIIGRMHGSLHHPTLRPTSEFVVRALNAHQALWESAMFVQLLQKAVVDAYKFSPSAYGAEAVSLCSHAARLADSGLDSFRNCQVELPSDYERAPKTGETSNG